MASLILAEGSMHVSDVLNKNYDSGTLYSRHYNHESAARALKLLIQEGDLRIICFL